MRRSKLRVWVAKKLVLLTRRIIGKVCHSYWTADWEFKKLSSVAEGLDELSQRIDEVEVVQSQMEQCND